MAIDKDAIPTDKKYKDIPCLRSFNFFHNSQLVVTEELYTQLADFQKHLSIINMGWNEKGYLRGKGGSHSSKKNKKNVPFICPN